MGARKRATPEAATKPPPPTTAAATTTNSTTDPPIAPPKAGQILTTSLIFFVPYAYLIFSHYNIEPDLKRSILINAVLSSVAFLVTLSMIPVASRYVLRRNLFGYDINKKGTPQGSVKVPESLGIVVGIVFLVFAILFQHFNFTSDSIWLVEYNAALASICFMILLGFVDDVLDVPWRVKLVLPSIAALPLLMAYAGHTTIVIPKPLVPYLGLEILDLGMNSTTGASPLWLHYEILVHNVMQIGVSSDPEYKQAHAFSIYLVQPLLATSMALFSYNWYPSSVFVGDTYTYFAGMTMAVAGILGHFSFLAIFLVHDIGCPGSQKIRFASFYLSSRPSVAASVSC
ncbi:hypothetical protein RHMOL_Rhmol04G0148000 [Rhododendron molle]|uniref:Uncharacterized protein n=1 Tax=Rhododendron molle TaxID=49168 RepID=A0ACC0P0T1_RHOML|nr:hypothetical protein RHMOL_Rhmol04G0148000 [Rhododendron molle]